MLRILGLSAGKGAKALSPTLKVAQPISDNNGHESMRDGGCFHLAGSTAQIILSIECWRLKSVLKGLNPNIDAALNPPATPATTPAAIGVATPPLKKLPRYPSTRAPDPKTLWPA